jgi:hypothetical protein
LRAQDQHKALKYSSIGIMVTAVLGVLLLAPVVQGVAQNNIANPTMQVVVAEVVSALLRGYAGQSLLIFFIGLILFVFNHLNVTKSDQAEGSSEAEAAAQQPPAAAGDTGA